MKGNVHFVALGAWRRTALCWLAALAFLLALPLHAATVAVPELKSWVTDQTGTLDSNTRSHLEQALAELEKRKGAQLAVLVVPTTGEDTVETYARRVFDHWRIGRAKVDDGILFLVAKDDRRLRIEVGYGLEGAVPDLLAGRIIREQVTPHFRSGDYAGGIVAGVDSLIALIDGEALPPPPAHDQQDAADDEEDPLVMLLPLVIMSFFMPAGFAALAVGFFVGLIFGSVPIGIAGGVIAYLLSRIGRKLGAGGKGSLGRASRRGGALGGGLGGGFGGGFGGGGGGGFGGGFGGGGGGGSGGGGASGSW